MVAARDAKNSYLTQFSKFEEGLGDDAQSLLRRDALDRFAALGFPTPKDEDWRFTNLTALVGTPFELGLLIAACTVPDATAAAPGVSSFPIPHSAGTFLLFGNGHRPILCKRGKELPDGVLVCGLAEALAKHPDLVEPHLAHYADYRKHAFTALNTAFLQDGAFVYVPEGQVVEEPICLVFSTTVSGAAHIWQRRCLMVIGAGSQVQIIESYDGRAGVYFTNAVTEIVVAPNAVVNYHRLQQESREAFHVATVQVRQDRDSRFTSHHIDRGSALARTGLNVVLDAEGCECTLNGLFLADGNRLVDNHTRIDHVRPRCASHELYKGILDDRAHGVFSGAIYVHPDAQKTDAKQTNRTLLLSDDAVIDAKPQLEIYADDVKCTHGASIGQLDEEAIFYLRTRGIDRDAACRLLTSAFANDIIGRIRLEPLRAQLEAAVATPPAADDGGRSP